jgi:Glycosyl transferase family 2
MAAGVQAACMTLVATLLVRDEEEVLRAHLDYHLAQGVDLVVAMDNGSRDATPEILREYARRGVVDLLPEAEPGHYRQGPWVTQMARVAALEHGADWVLHLDADEFWWPREGTLPDVLAAVPERYGVVNAVRVDFDPVPACGFAFWEDMTVRRRVLRTPLGHRGLPRVAHRGHPEVEVSPGNHLASGEGLALAPPVELIESLHFPTRSFEQLERKVRAHAVSIRSTPGLKADVGEETLSLEDLRAQGRLRAYFDERAIGADRRQAGVAAGELMEDLRLRDFFAAGLDRRSAQPAATQALAERFLDVDDWLGLQVAAVEARSAGLAAELEAERRHVEGLQRALDQTDQALRRERAEHFTTAETLRVLRQSRALRVAAGLRRVVPRRHRGDAAS